MVGLGKSKCGWDVLSCWGAGSNTLIETSDGANIRWVRAAPSGVVVVGLEWSEKPLTAGRRVCCRRELGLAPRRLQRSAAECGRGRRGGRWGKVQTAEIEMQTISQLGTNRHRVGACAVPRPSSSLSKNKSFNTLDLASASGYLPVRRSSSLLVLR